MREVASGKRTVDGWERFEFVLQPIDRKSAAICNFVFRVSTSQFLTNLNETRGYCGLGEYG